MKCSFETHWLEANKICIAKGDATANSLMFECKADHKMFFKLWDKYMSEMAELINYYLSPTGWTLLFKTRSSLEIQKAYLKQRRKSKKAQNSLTHKDPKRMLSEHFRIFLSQYVRLSNQLSGRSGTKVKHRFTKYVILEAKIYEEEFKRIVQKQRRNSQNLRKYKADEKHYDLKKEMPDENIWKVGNLLYSMGEIKYRIVRNMRLLPPKSYILRKFLANPYYPLPSLENP